jgi:hypothetical protein
VAGIVGVIAGVLVAAAIVLILRRRGEHGEMLGIRDRLKKS